jgi:hypothetical protein
MLRSYSVIVPVLNKQHEIVGTLRSIADSMAFFDDNRPETGEVRGEVIVVDDGSTDGTLELVRERVQTDPRFTLIQHHRTFGAGPARNTGVRVSDGEVLFFCDGDDLYFPEHLFVGFSILDRSASIADAKAETIRLRIGNRGHVEFSARRPVAAVRTGVHIKDAIEPYWKAVIQNTLVQNLCVRRECHDWTEGFPEELVYKGKGCEDGAYNSCLDIFFQIGQTDMETVEHIRYPGNSFDRQIQRFQHPPDSQFDVSTAEQHGAHNIRLQREDQKIGYLLDKWLIMTPPALPGSVLNWAGVVAQLLRRRRVTEAVRVADHAAEQRQSMPAAIRDMLKAARESGCVQ